MRVHYLQHVPFEDLGSIEPCLLKGGHTITCTRLYAKEPLPEIDDIHWLIVMGGPMGIYDETQYPWLKVEKEFIKKAIESKKAVLGICLGAQLIADVLGAKVYPNKEKEIGWFNIRRSEKLEKTILSEIIPETIEVFHWHGDTFDLPDGALPIAGSQACMNQGFIKDNRVIGFQFHLETTPSSARNLIIHCSHELVTTEYVQTKEQILASAEKFDRINHIMLRVLAAMENQLKSV